MRPSVSKTAAPPEYVNIMRDCWSEQPELRPTFDQLYSMFKSLNGDKLVELENNKKLKISWLITKNKLYIMFNCIV